MKCAANDTRHDGIAESRPPPREITFRCRRRKVRRVAPGYRQRCDGVTSAARGLAGGEHERERSGEGGKSKAENHEADESRVAPSQSDTTPERQIAEVIADEASGSAASTERKHSVIRLRKAVHPQGE